MREKTEELTVCVVGLGQIGGSFALALKENDEGQTIIGVDRKEVVRKLKRDKVVDEATDGLEKAVEKADFIFLSTPVLKILELLPRIAARMKPGAILLDSGSTKKEISQLMQEFPDKILIGGHPMAGREKAGFEAALPTLFRKRIFALIFPTEKSLEGKSAVFKILEKIGALPLEIEAEKHDRIVSLTSHLPYLISLSLSSLAEEFSSKDSLYLDFIASGFLGMTRLSLTQEEMGLGILATNSSALAEMVDEFVEKLKAINSLVQKGGRQKIMNFISGRKSFLSGLMENKDESVP
ncbi:MAG: prephenate dehydrogenase [Candidatus Aminicenantales bacterium]